jgi:hypothetical protein
VGLPSIVAVCSGDEIVGVGVGVAIFVGVAVGVAIFVGIGVATGVGVAFRVGAAVAVIVALAVGAALADGAGVGLGYKLPVLLQAASTVTEKTEANEIRRRRFAISTPLTENAISLQAVTKV